MQKNKKKQNKWTANKMADLNPNMVVITLNVNGISTPIQRQRLAGWIKKVTKLYVFFQKLTSNIVIYAD